jgi:hypothetical protein
VQLLQQSQESLCVRPHYKPHFCQSLLRRSKDDDPLTCGDNARANPRAMFLPPVVRRCCAAMAALPAALHAPGTPGQEDGLLTHGNVACIHPPAAVRGPARADVRRCCTALAALSAANMTSSAPAATLRSVNPMLYVWFCCAQVLCCTGCTSCRITRRYQSRHPKTKMTSCCVAETSTKRALCRSHLMLHGQTGRCANHQQMQLRGERTC